MRIQVFNQLNLWTKQIEETWINFKEIQNNISHSQLNDS